MENQKPRRSAAGFRLDPAVLKAFRAKLRERGMAMQPTLETWVKQWLDNQSPYAADTLVEIRNSQEEIRTLLLALGNQQGPAAEKSSESHAGDETRQSQNGPRGKQ